MSSNVLSSAAVRRASETKATTRPSVLTSTVANPAAVVSRCRARRCSGSPHAASAPGIHIAQTAASMSQAITAP